MGILKSGASMGGMIKNYSSIWVFHADRGWNLEWKDRFLAGIEEIQNLDDPKAANYLPENFGFEKHLRIDLLMGYDENQDAHLMGFCGVFNGGRFPEGVYRILNRAYVFPNFRSPKFAALLSQYVLPKQIEEEKEKLKFIFVSREKPWGKNFLADWVTHFAPDSEWKVSEKMYQVVPKGWRKGCFQYIAYREFEPSLWKPEKIDEKTWARLEDDQSAATIQTTAIFNGVR